MWKSRYVCTNCIKNISHQICPYLTKRGEMAWKDSLSFPKLKPAEYFVCKLFKGFQRSNGLILKYILTSQEDWNFNILGHFWTFDILIRVWITKEVRTSHIWINSIECVSDCLPHSSAKPKCQLQLWGLFAWHSSGSLFLFFQQLLMEE